MTVAECPGLIGFTKKWPVKLTLNRIMKPDQIALLSSFVLYVVFVLLPMVPTILIYKLFPETKVDLSGPVHGLTMKAKGAFAAYIVTMLLGFFLIKHTQHKIDNLTQQNWEVRANFEFLDVDTTRIKVHKMDHLPDVKVQVIPPPYTTSKIKAKLFLAATDEQMLERMEIQYSLAGFKTKSVKLLDFKIDHSNNLLNLGTITLQAIPPYVPVEDQLMPSTGGPPSPADAVTLKTTPIPETPIAASSLP